MLIFDSFDLPAQFYEVAIFGLASAFLLQAGWIIRNLSRVGELERSLEAKETAAREAEDQAKHRVAHLERNVMVGAMMLGDARQRLNGEREAAKNLFQFSLSEIRDLELRVARAETPRSVDPRRDPVFDLLFGSGNAKTAPVYRPVQQTVGPNENEFSDLFRILTAPQRPRPGHWTVRTVSAGDPLFDAIFGSSADANASDAKADTNASDANDIDGADAKLACRPKVDIDSVIDAAVKATFDTKVGPKVDTNTNTDAADVANVEESMRRAFSRLRQPPEPGFRIGL